MTVFAYLSYYVGLDIMFVTTNIVTNVTTNHTKKKKVTTSSEPLVPGKSQATKIVLCTSH